MVTLQEKTNKLNRRRRKIILKWIICYLWGEAFDKKLKKWWKTSEVIAITGNYRGTSHLGWNLRYKGNSYISVVAHNSSGYDNHLIIVNIAEKLRDCSFLSMDENTEKYNFFH